MSRQQLLYRLLEKAEKGNHYVYTQFCEISKSCSPTPAIKRMQILQGSSSNISSSTSNNSNCAFLQKKHQSNVRRVFILQKMSSASHKSVENQKEASFSNYLVKKVQNNFKQQNLNLTPIVKSVDQIHNVCIQTAKTQAQSPIHRSLFVKSSFSVTDPIRDNFKTGQPNISITRTEKSCIFKSSQIKVETARLQSHQSLRSKSNKQSVESATLMNSKNEQKKNKILLRKQLNKNYQKAFEPPPKISAKSYIVYEMLEQQNEKKYQIKIHSAFNSKIRVQIASLTKIMTCILAMDLCKRFDLDSRTQEIKIGKFESSIGGTTANISIGQIYTLHDLLHGLMLPSGNDASVAIAVWGGKKMIQYKQKTSGVLEYRKKMKKQCYDRFIQEMNAKSIQLGLTKTNYANSHGLINLLNRSCAHDVAVLSHYCMQSQYFRSVVSSRNYQSTIKVQTKITIQSKVNIEQQKQQKQQGKPRQTNADFQSEDQQLSDVDSETCSNISISQQNQFKQGKDNIIVEQKIVISEKTINWENTHKLLQKYPKQYLGIKTGVTTAAGPCLSSCIQTQCGRKFFIVVLNCKKLSMRFKQTQILKKWIYKKEGIKKIYKATTANKNQSQSQAPNSQNQSQSLQQLQNPNEPYD